MPFDATNYLEVAPAKVYDKDNPPTRMSEAIRMAVADVEAQHRTGIQYEWFSCHVCIAGAVARRVNPDWVFEQDSDEVLEETNWYDQPERFDEAWMQVLHALSRITMPMSLVAPDRAFDYWPSGFAQRPTFDGPMFGYNEPHRKWCSSMLALADRLEAEGS